MGWPSVRLDANAMYIPCVPLEHDKLSYYFLQETLGNGLHLATISAWYLYVHAHVMRRDVLSKMAPMITFNASEESGDCKDEDE